MSENIKNIEWLKEFGKLFPDHTERKLKDNHRWCDKCNGIGFSRKGNYIEFCGHCHGTGMIELCSNGCGKDQESHMNMCKECYEKLWSKQAADKEKRNFEKAEKIQFKEYEGAFLVDGHDRIMDSDEIEEWIYDILSEGEEPPHYIYATQKYRSIDIDIFDVVSSACEDNGYEEQYENLNTKELKPVQELLDKWIQDQGESAYVYTEDHSRIVLLDDIIEEIRNDIAKEKADK